ncbi:MAG: hypothetical protein IKR78_01630 [Dehalococcoidales bacterium]|nr:hypothetical protein [Dehalococcoidales bacterium]
MSSRGAIIRNGHVTTDEYTYALDEYDNPKKIYDAKVLVGVGSRHNLPDYSHSPNAVYTKENNGMLRQLRFYDSDGYPVLEIGYHFESHLSKNNAPVLHYHLFKKDLEREDAMLLSSTACPELYGKYKKYLEAYGL